VFGASCHAAIVVPTTPRRLQALVHSRRQTTAQALAVIIARAAFQTEAAALTGRLWAALADDEVIDDELVQRGLFYLLGVLQRHYNVDRDRVIVDAAGGACGVVLRAATTAPDRFAGLVLRAPQIAPDALDTLPLENLDGVDVLVLRGSASLATDAAADQLATALAGARGGRFDVRELRAADAPQLDAWCAACRREPLPKRVRLVMRGDGVVDGYWVTDISADVGGITRDDLARIEVVADRERGRITVRTRGIERFSLLLNDALIDLDRAFVLSINDVEVSMRRSRSLMFVCDSVVERFDPAFLFTAAVTIDVPRQG
jgi:hypothetical protein